MQTVLLVDDADDLRAMIARVLQQEGFHVLQASNGTDALRILCEPSPKLVLLDISMPDMSGLEVLVAARWLEGFASCRFVMFSAMGEKELEAAIAAGAVGFISKGNLDLVDFVERVRRHAAELPSAPEREPQAPPFAFRLSSAQCSTDWLHFRHAVFADGSLQVMLSSACRLPFDPGETVIFETRLGRAEMILQGLTEDHRLIFRPTPAGSTELFNLIENTWEEP